MLWMWYLYRTDETEINLGIYLVEIDMLNKSFQEKHLYSKIQLVYMRI